LLFEFGQFRLALAGLAEILCLVRCETLLKRALVFHEALEENFVANSLDTATFRARYFVGQLESGSRGGVGLVRHGFLLGCFCCFSMP